ncbi:MAG: type II toxin-antitoxin system RelE/ParE family toxin, partial [Pseudomonadota bacterium]|nr:type II toxin-antitoxin system RelE/ParE family toxin [Pseudomonadota bacterium]
YTPEAASLILRLHPEIKRRIRRAIADLLADPFRGHALHADLSGFRSYRVKGYRVLYQINDRDACVEVYYVGRRRNVYESFQALLAKNNR